MKRYVLPHPTGIDALAVAECDVPRPDRGQVLVRMRAASLNYRDLLVAKGAYGRGGVPAGLVPLSDGAGEVEEVGESVTRFARGDRVAGIFMQRWTGGPIRARDQEFALGGAIDGVLAEYVLFEERGLVALPPRLSFEEGATLPCAAVTAWNALFGERVLQPGQSVLTLGTGGVSVFAIQFAQATGARIVSTSSSDAKLEHASALGAAETINYRATPDWEREVLARTDGEGVDHVVEVGGAGTLRKSLESARVGGAVALIGVLTGRAEINPMAIMRRSLAVRGIYVGSRAMFEAMNRAIAANGIHPVIDRIFPFAEARAAYRHLDSQSHVGKVVIRID